MSEVLVEVWRGSFLECQHRGHAVIVNSRGDILESWGNPTQEILPRSACKILQALPLVESGAADAYGLTLEHLALSCASHQGDPIHTQAVSKWLAELNLSEKDLRCGTHWPSGENTKNEMVRLNKEPCQIHNNCSGKHSGFLTLNKYLKGDAEYININHPVQKSILSVFEEMTGETSSGYGIDGCSAPNHATSLKGLATAMAKMGVGERGPASLRLVEAMAKYPLLVAGEGRACSELMSVIGGRVVLKTGAEGVYTAILPNQGLGIALKIEDGATRGSECAIAALLVRLGLCDVKNPMIQKRMFSKLKNAAETEVGTIRPANCLL
ncbi:asparaginase [Amylibacter sp.]|nr:asparaginase [Amylibacter sp.]